MNDSTVTIPLSLLDRLLDFNSKAYGYTSDAEGSSIRFHTTHEVASFISQHPEALLVGPNPDLQQKWADYPKEPVNQQVSFKDYKESTKQEQPQVQEQNFRTPIEQFAAEFQKLREPSDKEVIDLLSEILNLVRESKPRNFPFNEKTWKPNPPKKISVFVTKDSEKALYDCQVCKWFALYPEFNLITDQNDIDKDSVLVYPYSLTTSRFNEQELVDIVESLPGKEKFILFLQYGEIESKIAPVQTDLDYKFITILFSDDGPVYDSPRTEQGLTELLHLRSILETQEH